MPEANLKYIEAMIAQECTKKRAAQSLHLSESAFSSGLRRDIEQMRKIINSQISFWGYASSSGANEKQVSLTILKDDYLQYLTIINGHETLIASKLTYMDLSDEQLIELHVLAHEDLQDEEYVKINFRKPYIKRNRVGFRAQTNHKKGTKEGVFLTTFINETGRIYSSHWNGIKWLYINPAPYSFWEFIKRCQSWGIDY